jgi:colanic acid/amylovoran biosynthesis glycosyltransferase
LRIAYLVGEFPRLSETFILDEIKEHRRNGIGVTVLSLFRPALDSAAHANVGDMDAPIRYVFRANERLQRLERLWIAALALVTQWRLWRVMFGAGFGSRTDRMNILGLAHRLREVRRLGGIDLLHCHFGTRAHLAAALRSLGILDVKIVTTFHGIDVSALVRRKGAEHYQLLFRFGALFLPISEMWAHRLCELGCDPARIRVHHVGIDCSLNAFRERRLDSRADASVKLISVGRLVEKKGHTHTLRALAQLRRRRPDLSMTLDIVGEGDLKSGLEKEVAALELTDVVEFHGGLPHRETLSLLNDASIFILPSVTSEDGDMEGIPVSLMEAMARGIPVISTYHSGIPELIEDGVNGFLVPERDDEALARSIERTIDSAPRWPEIGRAGRRTIEIDFNRQKLGRRLIEHYRDLLPRQVR